MCYQSISLAVMHSIFENLFCDPQQVTWPFFIKIHWKCLKSLHAYRVLCIFKYCETPTRTFEEQTPALLTDEGALLEWAERHVMLYAADTFYPFKSYHYISSS